VASNRFNEIERLVAATGDEGLHSFQKGADEGRFRLRTRYDTIRFYRFSRLFTLRSTMNPTWNCRWLSRIFLGIATVLLTGTVHAQASTGVTDTEVVLGQSAALSGPAATLGVEMRDGALAYFDAVNARGGINGRKIRLVTLDDAYEPSRTIKNTVELMDKHNAFAMFGFVGAAGATSAQALVTQTQMPFFAPFSGAQIHREPVNKWTFNVRAGVAQELDAIIAHLMALSVTKIGVMYENDAYGQAGLNAAQEILKRRKLAAAAIINVDRGATDLKKAAADMRTAQPSAVIMLCSYGPCANFIRESIALGFTPLFWNVSSVGSRPLVNLLGMNSRGISISQVVPFPWDESIPIVREYQRAIKEKSLEPSFTSLEGYIAAKVFVEGLIKAGKNPTREGFVAALETMGKIDFGGYVVSYSPEDHGGSKFVDLTLVTRDGRFRR
jgi:branched-chain amino acid transport system substrate-binding protein